MPKSKTAVIEAFFPEVGSGKANQMARAEASRPVVAIRRALEEVMKRPGIKGKRVSTIKLTVSVFDTPQLREMEENAPPEDANEQ